jgi:hypothetical protein
MNGGLKDFDVKIYLMCQKKTVNGHMKTSVYESMG